MLINTIFLEDSFLIKRQSRVIAGRIPGKCNFFPRLGGTEAAGLRGSDTENLCPVSMAEVEAQVGNIKACFVRDKKMS